MSRYEIKAQGARAELMIYGDIGQSWDAEESNDAKTVSETINALGTQPIDVRINSFGGAVSDGLAIFNALRRHEGEVTTHIDGIAYSIASLIAMAGSQINMASNALMMIHAPWGAAIGNAVDMRDMADTLDKHAEAMIGSYVRAGGPDRATVEAWLKDGEDHYFSAVDAQAIGLVDAVHDDNGDLSTIAAALKDTNYRKPAAVGRESQTEAVMAETKPEGNPADSPATDDVVTNHSKTIQAAKNAGARAEKKRTRTIEDVFDGFYDADPLNPISAIRAECLDDVNCTELDARRKLQAYLANSTADPVIQAHAYDTPNRETAPPRASRHLGGAVAGVGSDEKVFGAMQDAIEHKLGVKAEIDQANPYAGFTFTEMARSFAKAAGYTGVDGAPADQVMRAVLKPGMSLAVGPRDIRAQHATGDFPGLLANVIDKQIKVMYEQADETWRRVALVGSVNDFRRANRPAPTAFDDLLMVPEGGEYKHGEQGEVEEFITAKKFGRIFSITREALLADDLSVFSAQSGRMAMAAARLVGDNVWDLYLNPPTLNQDGLGVFDPAHNNTGTTGSPSVTTLSEARRLMRVQKDPSGNATLGLAPALLIVPPGWETEALTLVTAQNLDYTVNTGDEITQQRAANQFGTLSVVVEHRLGGAAGTGTGWFMQTAPSSPVPYVEIDFVRGQETPAVETREGFDVDGIEYKIRQEFGVTALAYQSIVYNAGS